MLLRAFILRPLRHDLGRSALSVLAIALGVAVVVAIRVANRAAVAGFAQTTRALGPSADLLVSGPQTLPASLLARLAPLEAEAAIAPYLERRVLDPGARDALDLWGLDLVANAGAAHAPPLSFAAVFATGAPPILLGADYVHAHHYREGGVIRLIAGGAERRFTIAAVLPAAGADLAVVDLPVALAIFSPRAPAFDGLQVRLAPGASRAAVAAVLRQEIPVADTVAPPAARLEQDAKMLSAFRANLDALSYVALLVGVFLIYNTVSISVVRRRVAIATLRALGARRAVIVRLFLLEGGGLALLGGMLGLGLGWLFARAAVTLVTGTVNALYGASSPVVIRLSVADAAWGLGLALGAGVLAALAPARAAASVAPARALRAGSGENEVRRRRRGLLAAAAAFTLAAILLPLLPRLGGVPFGAFGSALAAVLAWACLAPPLLASLLPRLRSWLLARGWVAAGLAAGNLAGALRRTSVLVAALATAVGVMLGVAVMVGSFRQTVEVWIGQQLQADVFVRARDWTRNFPTPLDPAWVSALANIPGVASAAASHTQAWVFRGQPIFINTRWGLNEPARAAAPLYQLLSGSASVGGVLVSEPFARRFHAFTGAAIALDTPGGVLRLAIAGVFYDYSSDRGEMVLPREVYERGFGRPAITELALDAAPALGAAELRRRVALATALNWPAAALDIHDNAGLRAEAIRVFDQTFRITYALEAITLLVAILGVANTLLAVLLERKRELALLRALGSTRGYTRRILLAEAAWVAGFALTLGAGLGASLAWILVRVINVQSFGWTIQFHPPYGFVAAALAAVGVATLAAAWLPARAAQRLNPGAALGSE